MLTRREYLALTAQAGAALARVADGHVAGKVVVLAE